MPDDIIDRFAADYFTLNSISPDRRHRVEQGLRKLRDWLDKPLETATDQDLRRWLVSLMEEGYMASTANWYLRMMVPFFQWCWQQDVIGSDQFMRIRAVTPPRGYNHSEPRPYKQRELEALWRELDAKFPYCTNEYRLARFKRGTLKFSRDIRYHAVRLQLDAMIELALVCGLRRVEIYRLSIDDCHPDNKYIVVHGKRRDQHPKVREVPYADSTREAMWAWLRFRAQIEPPPGTRLWLSLMYGNGRAGLTEKQMAYVLALFGDFELHRLRHTCATERLRAGMPLEDLQQFLGHANIQMTLRYAKLVREDIHRSAAKIDADFQARIRPRRAA